MTRKPAVPEERKNIYQEIARLGERALDLQVQIVLDRFERTDRLVRLGVATVAGMIAVLGLLITQGVQLQVIATIGIGVSILFVLVSIYLLVRINTAFRQERSVDMGPNLGPVLDIVETDEMTEPEFAGYMANQIPWHLEQNAGVIQSTSQSQGRAVFVLVVGVVIHLMGIAYIIGGIIHG